MVWILVILLWGSAVWSVQDPGHSSEADHAENQAIEDPVAEEAPSPEQTLLEQLQERLKAVEARSRSYKFVKNVWRLCNGMWKRLRHGRQRSAAVGRVKPRLWRKTAAVSGAGSRAGSFDKIYEAMDPEKH